jgi:hypothetical protein
MNGYRRWALVFILAACVTALFVGCTGDTGPTGPQGEKGDKGDPGDPGGGGSTRTVMAGTTVPATPNPFPVDIPGLTLADPPLVSVFVQIDPRISEWDELPLTWSDGTNDVVSYASLREGGVNLWNCEGMDYIIIIIE